MPELQIAKQVRHCDKTDRDIDIAYETFGSAANPAMVLVMGLNGHMLLWDDYLCEKLAKHFFVIRFDNRDVGLSTKIEDVPTPSIYSYVLPWYLQWTRTPEPYTLDCMAKDLWALVDRVVGPGAKAHLMGASMGGMISQCAMLLSPERVLSLTSVMSTTGATDLPGPALWVKLAMAGKPKSDELEDRIAFRIDLLQRVLAYKVEGFDYDLVRENSIKIYTRSTYNKGFARQLAAIQRAPSRDEPLKKLGPERTPKTRVIHGKIDVLVPPEHGKRTADMIHGAKHVEIDNMGHAFVRREIDVFYAEICALNGLTP